MFLLTGTAKKKDSYDYYNKRKIHKKIVDKEKPNIFESYSLLDAIAMEFQMKDRE